MNVTANQVWAIESDLPDEWLGCLGCGITTGLGSIFHVAKVQPGQSVAVVGLGHLGQWMVQAAKVAGARKIIAVDPIAYRRELAGTLGATHVVDPSAEDSIAAVQGLTEGRGADVVMEAATLVSATRDAVLMSRRAGTVVLSSVQKADAEVTLPQVAISVQSRAIISTQNGNVRMRADLPRFIRMMEEGIVTAEPIVTTKYALDDINDALHASDEKRDLSGVIVPGLAKTEVLSRVERGGCVARAAAASAATSRSRCSAAARPRRAARRARCPSSAPAARSAGRRRRDAQAARALEHDER